jgi:hypothetical protein
MSVVPTGDQSNRPQESESYMRDHVLRASRRRDERLARIRKLTLWITGGAAAASLGMGSAFAHALPGHAASASTSSRSTSTGAGHAGTKASSSNGNAGTSASSGTQRGHHHRHRLAPPAQQPVSTPAPPVVSSGGS